MKWTRKDYNIEMTVLPNGNIRTHLDDFKKTSISEAQYINPKNIAPTVIAGGGSKIITDMAKIYRIRKLTARECFRLMGVQDNEIDAIQASGISESQQYKLAGNSIVVDTLLHGIYINLFLKDGIPEGQLF